MADQKISQLNALAVWAVDDEIAIVDTDLTETKRMTGANIKANVMLGFIVLEPSARTIDAAGAITITTSYVVIDTFGGGATDDLNDINGAMVDGTILIIRAASSARTVVVKDGAGNLFIEGDFSMDHATDTMKLIYRADITGWLEVSRSNNA